jgi:hypothetical protein
MKTTSIKAIFTNLLFVIGVILMVIGFIRGTSTAANSLVFPKYPLNQYEETRCQLEIPAPAKIDNESTPIVDQKETEMRKQQCEESMEYARKTKQVNDITQSISFFISGLAIALIFKRFIFTKKEA